MLKLTSFATVLVLITFIAGAYYLLYNPQEKTALATPDFAISLYVESGEVSYKEPGMSDFAIASTSPIAIANQTIVKTATGTASVLMPDNSVITLAQNTEITIFHTKEQTSIFQSFGSTYHRVETLITGASYEVQTPGTLAAVRGTKFGVSYDKEKKETKVAVTESRVAVARLASTTTERPTQQQMITVEQDQVIKVDESVVVSGTTTGMEVKRTIEDRDMSLFVKSQKERDVVMEQMKQEKQDKQEFRKELRKVMFDDIREEKKDVFYESKETKKDTQEERIKKMVDVQERNKESETKTKEIEDGIDREETENIPLKKEEPKKVISETREVVPINEIPVGKKINEETFFDAFNTLFINNLYLDENDTACKSNLSGAERVALVTKYARESGYPFTSTTLATYAEGIADYCKNKNPTLKNKLQGDFERVFPYQEDL